MPIKTRGTLAALQPLARCFKGLADPTRLRILNLLVHGELCGCDIQHVMGTSQPNVSRHLTYLKHCRLLEDRREGFRVFYRLTDMCQGEARPVFEFLRQAFARDPVLRSDTQKLKQAIREGASTVSEFRPYAALVTRIESRA